MLMNVWEYVQINIVRDGLIPKYGESLDHTNAPTTPKRVLTMLISATAAGFMWRFYTIYGQHRLGQCLRGCSIELTVFANNTAVPLTVATPSLIINHAARNNITSFNLLALMTVFHSPFHEYVKYFHFPPLFKRLPTIPFVRPEPLPFIMPGEYTLPSLFNFGSGGPGLGLNHMAVGIVNTNHHKPTSISTSCRLHVVDPVNMTKMIPHVCINTAPQYPMAIPYDDIWEDSTSAAFLGLPSTQ